MSGQVIARFAGPYFFLSNFYRRPLVWDGAEYRTAEHAFQAGKALDPTVRGQIAAAPRPSDAKRLGATVALRPAWDTLVRYQVMREVLQAKFADPYLRRLLLATGEARLIEGNIWHDTHWGCCVCEIHQGRGDNWLGRMLEERRSQLRQYA